MNSPAYDIALYLVSKGVGAFGGNAQWAISVSSEAADPSDVITLYDTGGTEPDTDELDLFLPTFQVRVRAADYTAAWNKQKQIRDFLINPAPLIAATSHFITVAMSGDVLSLGFDRLNRHLLTSNYRSIRKET